MEDQFSQYKRSDNTDSFAAYKRPEVTPEEPGWFQPGSRSESLTRGFSNAATFGMGDEASAAIRSLMGAGKYKELRDQERAANENAAETHPGYNLAGNIVGAIPQGLQAVRSGLLQGPTLLKQALGAGKAGLAMGAAQGVGATKDITDIPQVAKDVAAHSVINGAINAGAVPLAAVATKFGTPVANYLKTAASKTPATQTADQTAKVLTEGKPSTIQPVIQTAGSVLADKFSLPVIGGLLGAGGVNIFGDSTGKKPDWSTDPYSAAGETALAAGQGALAGAGLKYGSRMAKNIAGDVYESAVKPAVKGLQQGVDNLVTTGETAGPFSKLGQWMKAGQSSPNPVVQQAAAEIDQTVANSATPDATRQAAMTAQSSPVGRAATNSDSPLHTVENDVLDRPISDIAAKVDRLRSNDTNETISPESMEDIIKRWRNK